MRTIRIDSKIFIHGRHIIVVALIAMVATGTCLAQVQTTPSSPASSNNSTTAKEGDICTAGQMTQAPDGGMMQCKVSIWHPILKARATIYSGGKVLGEKDVEVTDRTQVKFTGTGGDGNNVSYTIKLTPVLQTSGSIIVDVTMSLTKQSNDKVVKSDRQSIPVSSSERCQFVQASTLAQNVAHTFSSGVAHPDSAFNSKVSADEGQLDCSVEVQIGMASVAKLSEREAKP
jgi:hypothetical protein